MSRVYGDSTPFPHDIDYIEMLRGGIDCAVSLLSAHHSMRAAVQRAEASRSARDAQVAELGVLLGRVQEACRPSLDRGIDRTVSTAAQLISAANGVVDQAKADAEAGCEVELGQVGQIEAKARESAAGAIERFAARHAAPGSLHVREIKAEGPGYRVQVSVTSPYGLATVFSADVPDDHVLSRPRRVSDFVPALEVHLPQESGWLSKRVEMAPVRLEKLFVSELRLADKAALLRITKAAGSGSGYAVNLDYTGEARRVEVREVLDDGELSSGEGLLLRGDDEAQLVALLGQLDQGTRDLIRLRTRLVSGEFEQVPLLSLHSPQGLADALIANMAPVVREISLRSGAPGELVLRRDQGEGRREETYCTHAELLNKIQVLPPDLHEAFRPLQLTAEPRGKISLEASAPALTTSTAPRALSAPPTEAGRAASQPPAAPDAVATGAAEPTSVPPRESRPPAA